jgi:hypothetical protein
MTNGSVFLYKGGKDAVSKAIAYITKSPYAHTAIYLEGFTFDSTVWLLPNSKPWMLWRYRSGVRWTIGVLDTPDLVLDLKIPFGPGGIDAGMVKALEMINGRAWYNFLLLVVDALLYPTRPLWKWIYAKTGWAPFAGPMTNCSKAVDVIYKAMGVDLWADMPESLTVPGDYPNCAILQEEST